MEALRSTRHTRAPTPGPQRMCGMGAPEHTRFAATRPTRSGTPEGQCQGPHAAGHSQWEMRSAASRGEASVTPSPSPSTSRTDRSPGRSQLACFLPPAPPSSPGVDRRGHRGGTRPQDIKSNADAQMHRSLLEERGRRPEQSRAPLPHTTPGKRSLVVWFLFLQTGLDPTNNLEGPRL